MVNNSMTAFSQRTPGRETGLVRPITGYLVFVSFGC